MALVFKPNGTLNVATSPSKLSEFDMQRCKNLNLDRNGLIQTRNGSRRIFSNVYGYDINLLIQQDEDVYIFNPDPDDPIIIGIPTPYSPPIITSPSWKYYFDNTKWKVDPDTIPLPQGSWDGSKWDSSYQDEIGYATGYYIKIIPIGSWYVGYRPTLAMVVHNGGADVSLQIGYVGGGRNTDGTYASSDALSLSNIGANNIASLFMYSLTDFSVTNIGFYG